MPGIQVRALRLHAEALPALMPLCLQSPLRQAEAWAAYLRWFDEEGWLKESALCSDKASYCSVLLGTAYPNSSELRVRGSGARVKV